MILVIAALAFAYAPPAPAAETRERPRFEAERAKLEAELDALEARAKAEDWHGPSTKAGKRAVAHAFDAAMRAWMLCAMDAAKRLGGRVPTTDAFADAALNQCIAFEADLRRASALDYREMGASDAEARSELVRRDTRYLIRRMIGEAPGRSR
jgi:hypothetical protein